MSNAQLVHVLPSEPDIPADIARAVEDDYHRLAESGPPDRYDAYVSERYGIDLAAEYAGFTLKNPWGKASGQLSMTARQVADDVEAGLGFVVLKTVIAEDAVGGRSMQDWALRESRMLVEPIVGRSGRHGWTVSWKGRGWWQTFDEYLALIRDGQRIAQGSGTLIVPSCKFHLPTPEERDWRFEEYFYTTTRLLDAWHNGTGAAKVPMPLEKDFSPTLAGSDRAAERAKVLEWIDTVPQLVRRAALAWAVGDRSAESPLDGDTPGPSDRVPLRIGLKLFNALFDDDFQLEMLRAVHETGSERPDFFVYANRLFDPDRTFDGHAGIAYGGPDLSDRNLRVMTRFQDESSQALQPLPWSATGDIATGKMALEYALRGASSFQLHTFFQLPAEQYRMKTGTKVQKALHELYLHPYRGFVVWLHHVARALDLSTRPIRFRDVIGRRPQLLGRRDDERSA